MTQVKLFPTKKLLPSLRIYNHYYKNAFLPLLLWFFIFLANKQVQARTSPKLYLIREDPMKNIVTQPLDIYRFTVQPSQPPSNLPSQTSSPTRSPSLRPTNSRMPTQQPSNDPSLFPSLVPSVGPSIEPSMFPQWPSLIPTLDPSSVVTSDDSASPSSKTSQSPYYYPLFENNAFPFNYNPYDANFGPGQPSLLNFTYNETIPVASNSSSSNVMNQTRTRIMNYTKYEGNGWESVRESYESNYWKEFDMQRTLENRCSSDPWRRQSPIDLCPTAVNSECFEHHQIRNRGGDYNLDDAEVTLKILPSKLRIEYSRENANLDESLPRPPHADFAHNWNGYISAVHIDIKIPSEHTVCGKRFAGEYQIYFYHGNRKQPIVQSVLMEIHPNERPHLHFQKALNEWQVLFDEQKMTCLDKIRKEKEAQEVFKRRMENYLNTGIDSHEVSSLPSSSLDNVNGVKFEHSTILDEPLKDRKRFQKRLKNLRRRASNPVFEEQEYQQEPVGHSRHLRTAFTPSAASDSPTLSPTIFSTTTFNSTSNKNRNTTECIDSMDEFVFQDMNVTCETIKAPSNLDLFVSFCTNANETTVRSMCPVTCGICHTHNHDQNTSTNTTTSFAPSSSPIPSRTSAPTRAKWNPFQPRILNSIYFYGYGGSLTEPPCSEWVAWRVLDVPMQISTSQWNQMRDILFHQVDDNCRRTSVSWNGSVARPTQSLNDRPLWRCTKDDYLSDVERQRLSPS